MSPVNIIAVITPQEGFYTEAFEIFSNLCQKVGEVEPECLSFLIFHGQQGEIIISKRYASMEAYQAHRKSAYVTEALSSYKSAKEPVIKTFDPIVAVGFGSPDAPVKESTTHTRVPVQHAVGMPCGA